MGVDQWYWKGYEKAARQQDRIAPDMPLYLLDKAQWYPPLFPWLLIRLPDGWLERNSWWLAIVIDLARMALLVVGVIWIAGNWNAAILAALVYALTPIVITYNTQLNPRGLGAFFLDLIALLVIAIYLGMLPFWAWLIVSVLAGLLLLTHKMSTQLFWFICVAIAAFTGAWKLVLLVPVSIAMAYALSGGFYAKVLRAHWDIVTFWHRNWPWLQAHPVKESPIYGESSFQSPGKLHQSGWGGFLRHCKYLLAYSPVVWLSFILILWGLRGSHLDPLTAILEVWVVAVVLFALMTTFVPSLKCLGSGYLYMYNGAFPAAILLGMITTEGQMLARSAFVLTLVLGVGGIAAYLHQLRSSRENLADAQFDALLAYLKSADDGVVMCLPAQPYDSIAYRTGKRVLWGGHGYGFTRLEVVFPRLMKPMAEILADYGVRYLVIKDGYLPERFVQAVGGAEVRHFGPYHLFCGVTWDEAVYQASGSEPVGKA